MWSVPQLSALVLLIGTSVVCLCLVVKEWGQRRQGVRLRELIGSDAIPAPEATGPKMTFLGELALTTFPRIGAPLLPGDSAGLTVLENRMRKAGYYHRHASAVFIGVRIVLLAAGVAAALILQATGILPLRFLVPCCCILGSMGLLLPGLWLDMRSRQRQDTFRRALPDALDVIVICLEGGLSLPESIRRVSNELETAHPLLALEMKIIQREVLLGLSPGEAMRQFSQRCDLEEVRSLAGVLMQSERFGASTTKAMRVQADQLRIRRHQRAEERAQRAAVFILFPTLLCIFPAVFLVLLGPAMWRIMDMFSKLK